MIENNIRIFSSDISGIINSQLIIKGHAKIRDCYPLLRVYSQEKLIAEQKIDKRHFCVAILLKKEDRRIRIVEVVDNKELQLCVKKNTLLRRILYKIIKSLGNWIKKIKKDIIQIKLEKFRRTALPILNKEYNRLYYRGFYCSETLYYPLIKPDYIEWYHKQSPISHEKLKYQPLISILMPVYNTDAKLLQQCLDSILNQSYQNFELCITDDCSTDKNTKKILKEYGKKDDRIKIQYRKENGHISKATNDSLSIAKGEYVGLVDSDDLLCEDALYEVAYALNKNSNLDLIYTDEDKIDLDNNVLEPHFKQDFGFDSFLNSNYICHFCVLRTALLKTIEGFKDEFVGAQDYDLLLRFVEKISNEHIYHIEKVLYHWRKNPNSTADTILNKPYAINNGKKAVKASLKRQNLYAEVKASLDSATYIVKYLYKKEPKISIIINDAIKSNFLEECVDSFYEWVQYQNIEVIILSAKKKKSLDYLLSKYKNLQIKYIKHISIETLNNVALHDTSGEYLLFLDSDMEFVSKETFNYMVGYAMQQHIGAVAPKIMYQDDTVKSAGIVIGKGDIYHKYSNYKDASLGNSGVPIAPIDCAAVSSSCLMINKEKFREVGGFDSNYQLSYYDSDIGIKLLQRKYNNVALLNIKIHCNTDRNEEMHFIYKNYNKLLKDQKCFKECWQDFKDPFYNRNFSFKETGTIDR